MPSQSSGALILKTSKRKPNVKTAQPVKRQKKPVPQLIQQEAELSGEASSDEEEEDDCEEAERELMDPQFIDNTDQPVKKLPKLTKEDYELCDDDYQLMKDNVLALCVDKGSPTKTKKRVTKTKSKKSYADEDQLEEVHTSDLDFVASETSDSEAENDTAKKVGKKTAEHLQDFCRKQGLLLEREKHTSDFKNKRKQDTEEAMKHFCLKKTARPSAVAPSTLPPKKAEPVVSRVRPLKEERKVAAVFNKKAWAEAQKRNSQSVSIMKQDKPYEGIILDLKTNKVSYQNRNGQRESRPGMRI